MTEAMLRRFRAAMDAANFWDRFETDWALLDGELMPWSAKAQALLPEQYAATAGLGEAVELLEKARRSGLQTDDLLADFMQRKTRADSVLRGLSALLLAVDLVGRLPICAVPFPCQ